MNLISVWEPNNEGTGIGNAFMIASLSAPGGRMGIALSKDGVISHMTNRLFQKTTSIDLSIPDLYPEGHPVLTCLSCPSYAFSANVSDEEINLWDGPVKEHPNSIPVIEMVAATKRGKKHWMAEYELSLSGLSFKIFEIDFNNSTDPRFTDEAELPENVIETLGLSTEENIPALHPGKGVIPFRCTK